MDPKGQLDHRVFRDLKGWRVLQDLRDQRVMLA